MIYILHGDDAVTSRKRLVDLTDGYKKEQLDGKNLTIALLEEKVLSSGLFGDEQFTIVENLVSKNSKKKDFLDFVQRLGSERNLILWEDKKLAKNIFSKISNAKVEEYSFPTYYFKFLDSFSPSNKRQVYDLYHELLNSYAPEQVFYSLVKRVRQLVVLSSGAENDDLNKLAPWQKSNLKRQLASWKKESLLRFYENLRETEIRLKTGGLPVNLSKHLDILILSKLT